MTVRVVTDSTSDLPHDLARSLDITIVPLNVHFGSEVFKDGVDLSPDEFYQRLAESVTLPTTSRAMSVARSVGLWTRAKATRKSMSYSSQSQLKSCLLHQPGGARRPERPSSSTLAESNLVSSRHRRRPTGK